MPKKQPQSRPKRVANKSKASVKPAKKQRLRKLIARMKPGHLGRSHRSFRLTRRRDYVRDLALPGYFALSWRVLRVLGSRKWLFTWLIVLNMVMTFLLASIASQEMYQNLSEAVDIVGEGVGSIWQAAVVAGAGLTGELTPSVDSAQTIFAGFVFLLTWLVTVWLVRAIKSGQRPSLRDGLYSAGAPIVSTLVLVLVLVFQLLPVALALIGYQAAEASGLLGMGIEAMLFWVVAVLLSALSAYWVTTTLLSLVVVTLPGMYPMTAHRNAFMLVSGRRVRFMLRWLWLALLIIALWFVILVPVILLERWLVGLYEWVVYVPVIPLLLLLLTAVSVVFAATYVYVFYREVVDYDARKK